MPDDLDAEAKRLAYQAAGLSVELTEGPSAFEGEPLADKISPLQAEWIDPWGEPFTAADACKPRPPIEYIVQGLFRRRSLNMLYGPPGSLKTMLALDLCIAVAAGQLWLPSPPDVQTTPYSTIQMPTMFIDFDNGRDELEPRIEALIKGRNLEAENFPFYYHSFPEPGFVASNKTHIGDLMNRIDKFQIGMLWIDNLGIVKGSANENLDEMIPVMNGLRTVAEKSSAMTGVLHHPNKSQGIGRRTGETIRGHSSIEASLDVGLLLERKQYSNTIDLKPAKVRGSMFYPFSATWDYVHKIGTTDLEAGTFYGAITEGDLTDDTIDAVIKAALKDGSLNQTALKNAVKELMPEIGINRIRARIERMTSAGMLIVSDGPHGSKIYQNA